MLIRIAIVVAILAATSLGYMWWQRRDGKAREVHVPGALTPADLGAARGQRGTVVLFSTPMCAKCPGTKAMFARLLPEYEGVTQVEIDAAERLDIARRLNVMRTPTILVLDSRGVAVQRIDGAPSPAHAREALDALPPLHGYSI